MKIAYNRFCVMCDCAWVGVGVGVDICVVCTDAVALTNDEEIKLNFIEHEHEWASSCWQL